MPRDDSGDERLGSSLDPSLHLGRLHLESDALVAQRVTCTESNDQAGYKHNAAKS